MEIGQCPIVRPTEAEFTDFHRFIHRLDETYSKDYGMVKIVPPVSWKPQAKDYHQRLQKLDVRHPIEQNVQGKAGFFESKNIVQSKMPLKKYKKYAEKESSKVSHLNTSEKERMFWKTITYSSPIYGADLTGSLMDSSAGSWDLNCLDSILKYALTEKVKGVTQPYCYIGSWKAFFSWHKEDLDLGALNYIHEGASKLWYAISPDHSHILEEEAKQYFKAQARQCPEFLRHKTFLINPDVLLEKHKDLKITKTEHKVGQIMMVFGGAYHQGFNLGFNIAEAVNYGTKNWMTALPGVKFCKCLKKGVRGDIESILYNLQNSDLFQEIATEPSFLQLQQFILETQLKEQEECGVYYPEGTFDFDDKLEEVQQESRNQIDQAEDKKVKAKMSLSLKIKKAPKNHKRNSMPQTVRVRSGEGIEGEEIEGIEGIEEEEKQNEDVQNSWSPLQGDRVQMID